jgi:hypothetical protein
MRIAWIEVSSACHSAEIPMTTHARIRFSSYPKTEAPPHFTESIVRVFSGLSAQIATTQLEKGLTSDAVLAKIAPSLVKLGFEVESGKSAKDKVERPVFFGENGEPELRYQIDGFHAQWKCGIEVEAGRAFMSNAVYRDLIQAALMVDLDYLCLAVPMVYKFQTGGRTGTSRDYDNARAVADALYGHTRLRLPYRLLVIGY